MVGMPAMPPLIASLAHRLSPSTPMTLPQVLRLLPFAAFHLAALAIMVAIENGPVRMLVYLLTWGLSISSGWPCCAGRSSRPACRSRSSRR